MGFSLKYFTIIFIFCLLSFIIFFDASPIFYSINAIVTSILLRLNQETYLIYKINFIDRRALRDKDLMVLLDIDFFFKLGNKNHYISVGKHSAVDHLFIFSKNPLNIVITSNNSRPIVPRLIGVKVFSYTKRRLRTDRQNISIENKVFTIYEEFHAHSLGVPKIFFKWVENYVKQNHQVL